DRALFGPYASYVDRARDDPDAFAVLVTMKVGEQSADRLERMLMASLDRFDHTLGHQASHHRFVNDALHTLTAGAGEVAEVGLRLFTTGLSQQADKTRLEHDSAIERERNELLRDAIEQGSMLAQAIFMSNAVKQRHVPEHRGGPAKATATAPSGFESKPTLSPEEADVVAADDRCLEVRTRQVLGALTPETLDELR